MRAMSIALAALLMAGHCNAQGQKLSATELFELRGKCQKLGEQDKYSLRAFGGNWRVWWDAQYNIEDGRCYMKITAVYIDHEAGCDRVALYDAQTGDMKAIIRRDYQCPASLRGTMPEESGSVFSSEKSCGLVYQGIEDHGYNCTTDFINSKMKD